MTATGATMEDGPRLDRSRLLEGGRYRFHAMVKPAGSECNIDCHYCFYLHKSKLLDQGPRPRMDDATLAQHIRQYIEAQDGDEVVFSWQGGEPTLMGLDFYRRVVELQQAHARPGQRIENDLQTNGLLLDAEWIAFLKAHRFHVGLSIDGPRELHDTYRRARNDKPTFDYVMRAAALLREAEIPFAALCVVNRTNARRARDVYRFLVDEVGTWRVQFTPAVEPVSFMQVAPAKLPHDQAPRQHERRARPGIEGAIVTEWSVDPVDYGQFLIAVWDEWMRTDIGRVHVNLFETAVAQAAGLPAQMCTQGEFCGKAVAVEHDGEVFACDHFVYPEYRSGNIRHQHLGNLAFSPAQMKFGMDKRDTLPRQCMDCDYLKLCYGECPKNRLIRTDDGEPGLNYLCSGLYAFYRHIDPDVVRILQRIGGQSGAR
ncbi:MULTISPECIES: anaerobic sulfatase maturase [Stenotrophomonas]|nr:MULTISPECIES: anaerobic sulfatase maturase [Stenotrophomonas]OZB51697.1 MAG: anaerobic sulfatase maturase [Stenotrophomonas sp. 14-69-23]QOF99193.1 anaerobic sulfatase maturase [Stenotrophomonas sp. CW117]